MAGSWATFQAQSPQGSFAAETMLLLTDGSVLIHESGGANWLRLTPDGAGNYQTGTWSQPLPMANTRQFFSSAVLMDGRVYVVGGEDSSAGGWTPLGEIFDPQTNLWSALDKPKEFEYIAGDASGAVLADGRVLFGNIDKTSPPFSTAVWDPGSDTWTTAGSGFGALNQDSKRSNCNEETWTLLPDGSVLTVATLDAPRAERYVPTLDEWVPVDDTPTSLPLTSIGGVNIDEIGPAILLPDGRVFAIGATGQTAIYTPPPAGSDPKTAPGNWTAGPSFPADTSAEHVWPTLTASDAPAVLQVNGKVLCVAGILTGLQGDYFSANAELFEFDFTDDSLKPFVPAAPFPQGGLPWTFECRFLLLPTGQILLTTESDEIYLYTPDLAGEDPDPSWRPTLTRHPDTIEPGRTYTIEGTQLNGLSQAVSYGDDAQMATNYPIVRIEAGERVYYCRTHGFSTMAVATGDAVQSAQVEIPVNADPLFLGELGEVRLCVVANGIAGCVNVGMQRPSPWIVPYFVGLVMRETGLSLTQVLRLILEGKVKAIVPPGPNPVEKSAVAAGQAILDGAPAVSEDLRPVLERIGHDLVRMGSERA